MPPRVNNAFEKRKKEQARKERQKEKADRRAQREREKAERPQGAEEEDPDIAGIVPGPQPTAEELAASSDGESEKTDDERDEDDDVASKR